MQRGLFIPSWFDVAFERRSFRPEGLRLITLITTTFRPILLRQELGLDYYQSQTATHSNIHFNSYGSNGRWATGNASGNSYSTTQGTIHCEAMRQQALRDVQRDAISRDNGIKAHYGDWKERLSNFYLDSTTIFPGTAYGANFQIDVPSNIEKELKYLLFTFDLEGEKHIFCFDCRREKKKWYRLGY